MPERKIREDPKGMARKTGSTTIKTLIALFIWLVLMGWINYCIVRGEPAEDSLIQEVYEHAVLGLVLVYHDEDGLIYENAHPIVHQGFATKPMVVDAGRGGPYTSVVDPGDDSRIYTLITEPSVYRKNPPSSWKPCTEKTFKGR